MADADVQITAGSGTKIDTRTVGAGTDEHRQVVVQGDPSVAANVANVYVEGDTVTSPAGTTVLGRIHLTDPSSLVDGKAYPLTINRDGRLRVATKPGSYPDVTGGLTTSGTSLSAEVSDVSNVMLHVKNTGGTAMAAGNFTFEGSLDSTNGTDGTWFVIQVVRSNANTIETTTGTLSIASGAGLAYAWEASVNALKYVRVRCTTTVTAGSTAFWTLVLGSYATEPIPAAQVSGTQPVSGTVTANGGTIANPTVVAVSNAASTNATSSKASAGNIYQITVSNVSAETRYFKLYNKASAPTVGTDAPILVLPVPAGSFASPNLGPLGFRCATGIAWALLGSAGAADSATTVCSDANTTKVTISYV